MFEFEEQMRPVARLVEGVSSDPGDWDSATELSLVNAYGYSAFFSLDLHRLKGRCDRIVKRVNAIKLLKPETLNRGPFTSAAAGDAITLRQLVKINYALTKLAKSAERTVLNIADRDGRAQTFAMGNNSVIMSMHWVDGHMVRSLRKSRGLSKKQLGQLIFGKNGEAVFERLEEGTKTHGKKGDEKLYQYRITRHTADLIYRGFGLIFRLFPAVEIDHKEEGVVILSVLPDASDFFDDRHTVGPGDGKRTLALPVRQGNLLSAPSPADLKNMEARIREAAQARKDSA